MRPQVLVYDWGMSGKIIGKYIETELPVKVKPVIDAEGMGMADKTVPEICIYVEKALAAWVGTVEVIVLANPTVTVMAEEHLKRIYPRQKFVGYGYDLEKLVGETKQIVFLISPRLRRTEKYQMMKAQCQGVEIREPDFNRWLEIVRERDEDDKTVKVEMRGMAGAKVVVYNSGMLLMEPKLTKLVGWRGEVVDMRDQIVDNVKKALGLEF